MCNWFIIVTTEEYITISDDTLSFPVINLMKRLKVKAACLISDEGFKCELSEKIILMVSGP